MTAEPTRPLSAPHDPVPRRPKVPVPSGACDCHAHVFGPGNTYPFIPQGLYTPADALPAEHRQMLDALALAPQRLRGVAVLPFDADERDVERLHAQGVRGVRCNIVDLKQDKGVLPLDALRTLGRRIARFGWHMEFLMHVNEFPELDRQFGDFPVDVVFGHLGYVPATLGTQPAGFRALLRLLRDGKGWVKLTAPYRLTPDPLPYSTVTPFAEELLATAPDRLLWGSDWPHTFIKSAMPNDGDLFDLFAAWVPDEEQRRRILVDNPALLYGY